MGAVKIIPMLLHFSVLLFISGLVLKHLSVVVVGGVILAFTFAGLIGYTFLTILPVIWTNCPYCTPFSTPIRYCLQLAKYVLPQIIPRTAKESVEGSIGSLNSGLLFYQSWVARRESCALDFNNPATKSRLRHALAWTARSLTTDSEWVTFFASIPDALAMSDDGLSETAVSDAILDLFSTDSPHGVSLAIRFKSILTACVTPTTLSERSRSKRAAACMTAISAIVECARRRRGPEFTKVLLQKWDQAGVLVALRDLMLDRANPTLASHARDSMEVIEAGLEA